MKLYKRTAALLAIAGAAFLSHPARAANPTYTPGDLLLGFDQAGNTTVIEVDLGPATNYITPALATTLGANAGTATPGQTVTLSLTTESGGSLATDLAAAFPATGGNVIWSDNSQQNLVQWGVLGATAHLSTSFGLPANTIFLTQAETTPGTQSSAPGSLGTSVAQTADSTFAGLATGNPGGFSHSTLESDSSVVVTQSTGNSNNWEASTAGSPSSNALKTGLDVQQAAAGTYIGPTDSVLDLYALEPNDTPVLLGSFNLESNGELQYTAVPEPSTYALLGFGVLAIYAAMRRRRSLVAINH